VLLVLLFVVLLELLSVTLSLLGSVVEQTSEVDAVGLSPVLLLPLVSKRSIILDTDAIPLLTSRLTSEPRSDTDELREKKPLLPPSSTFCNRFFVLCGDRI